MWGRINVQALVIIIVVFFVVIYNSNTADHLTNLMEQFASQQRSTSQVEKKAILARENIEQTKDDFKESLLKELKIYIEWSNINSREKAKNLVNKIAEKLEAHFKRNPSMGTEDKERLRRAVQDYAYTITTSEVIPLMEYFNTLEMDDPILIDHVRKNLWLPGAPKDRPYALEFPNVKDHSDGQQALFLDVFGPTAFYIECGGLDGEHYSNTLDLEAKHNWTGILIEAAPVSVEKILKKNRRSVTIPACLSLDKRPSTVKFAQLHGQGKIINASGVPLGPYKAVGPQVEVHCLPFYTMYKAIGRSEIDIFVLDIEGHEVDVLLTIPFDKINIHTIMVEYINSVKYNRTYMKEFMFKQKFRLYQGNVTARWPHQNEFFIKIGSKYDRPGV